MMTTTTRDRATDAANAAAWLLQIPYETFTETVTAAMADRYANTERAYSPPHMPALWGRLSPEVRRSFIRDSLNQIAAYLDTQVIGPVLFPCASEKDSDEMAVPITETIVQAAYLWSAHPWTHVPDRRALREFRAVVASSVRFGFDDEED